MATFILVHGAFHGAWCWERLLPALEQRGHRAIAVDLPGMGADPRPAAFGTLARYADHVVAVAKEQPEKPILVGHSLGGGTISEAGERAPDALAGLVYLTAVLLPGGTAIGEMQGRGLVPTMDPPMRMIPDAAEEGCLIVHPDDVVPFMYHRTDAAGQRRAIDSVTPQPSEPFVVPMSATPERWGRLRRAYIECLDDQVLPITSQRRLQDELPCDPVIAIDTDHSPFFSAVDELADALSTIAEGWNA